jgi:hypothetical protein
MAGRGSDDMSDHVSIIALPDDKATGFDIKSDIDNSWHSRRQTGTLGVIQNAVTIRN